MEKEGPGPGGDPQISRHGRIASAGRTAVAPTLSGGNDQERGFVVIRVTDTGPGIPKGDLPRLGERFYRVDKTRSRELGGTGLGLSIVKHLMAAHGGRMDIESTFGQGTTVSLFFPAGPTTKET